jgi:hypothetical protein
MAVDFPTSPSNGQTFTSGTITYTYNATAGLWNSAASAASGGGGSSVTVSDTAPASPSDGDMWFNSSDLKLYIRYNDGATSQWIIAAPAGSAAAAGPGVTVSDTAPASPSDGDMWYNSLDLNLYVYYNDGSSSQWVQSAPQQAGADGATGAAGSPTSYANLAAFPSSGNTAGDFGFATDTKAIYVWDGTEWDRIYSGPQEMVEWSTAANSSYNLIIGDSSTTISPVATDPDGFGITYDYLTNPSNPSSATIVQGTGSNTNDFSITPDSATVGNFSLRITASDGVSKVSTVSAISITTPPLLTGALTNGLVAFYDAADAQSYSGTGSTWSDISGNGNHLTLATDGSMVYNSSGTGSRPSFTLGKSSANAHVFEQFSSSHNYNGTSYVPVFFVAILRHPISQNGYGQAGFIGRPQGTTPMLELHDFSQYTYYATSGINNSNGAQGGDIANVGSPGSQLWSDWWIDGTKLPDNASGQQPTREQYQIAMELDGTSGPAGSYSVDATKRDQFHSLMVSNIRLESGIRAAHSAAKPPTGIELRALAIYDYIPTDANKTAIHNVYQNLYGSDMASAP